MKKLSKFLYFDFEEFSKEKQYMSIGIQEWKDHDTGAVLGMKVEAAIVKDTTDYGSSKDGKQISNLFEKVIFKVPHEVNIPLNAEIIPINATANVYGEFRNQLSITAEDVQVVSK